jgi:hypothetical protein
MVAWSSSTDPKEWEMRKEREALLIAALAGLVIVGAAAFVVQPSLGRGTPEAASPHGSAFVLQGTTVASGKTG